MNFRCRLVLLSLTIPVLGGCGSYLDLDKVFRDDDPARSDGSVLGATRVRILGASFTEGTEVLFGGKPIRNKVLKSSGVILGDTPPEATLTPRSVRVEVRNGDEKKSIKDGWTYIGASLAFTSILPDTGSPTGGTPVTITGDSFGPTTTVEFQTAPPAMLQNVDVVDKNTIEGDAPAGAPGTVDIIITSPWDTLTVTGGFRFEACADPALPVTITSVSPASGPLQGGTRVALAGTGLVSGVEVTFGTDLALSPDHSRGPCFVEVETPAHPAAGAVDVTVTNPVNMDTFTLPGAFYYVGVSAGSVAPSVGPISGNTRLLIGGTGFVDPTHVLLGGSEVLRSTVISPDLLEVITPPGAAPGLVDVTICSGEGEVTLTGGFEYLPVSVDAIDPNFDTLAGGVALQITGTGLQSTNRVLLGTNELTGLSVDTVDGLTIDGTIPAGAMAGPVDLTIQMTAHPPVIVADALVYDPIAPVVLKIHPPYASRMGGDEVLVEGDDFVSAPMALDILFDTGGGGDDSTADDLTVTVQPSDIISTRLLRIVVPDKTAGSNNLEICEVGATSTFGSTSTPDTFAYAEWTSPGIPTSDVRALAGPDSSGNSFAGAMGEGVYASPDDGLTWTLVNVGPLQVQCLALAPVADVIYAGTQDMGVYMSDDGGATWSQEITGLGATLDITSLAVTPGLENEVYAATGGDGVWMTTGGGTPGFTWVKQSPGEDQIQSITVSPEILRYRDPAVDPGQTPYPLRIVAATTATGVFTSFDGGATWQDHSSGLISPDVRSVSIGIEPILDPALPTRQADNFYLYAATAAGISRGRSIIAIVDDPATPGQFLAAFQGIIWLDRNAGVRAEPISTVAISPAEPGDALAGTTLSGVFISEWAGCRWRVLDPAATLSNAAVNDLLILPDPAGAGATVLVATGGGGVNRIRIVAP